MIVFTSVCANYTPKATVLAKTLKKFNPDAKFVLGLTETDIPAFVKANEAFDAILLSSDLPIDDFRPFIFKHSIVEASTAVKGHMFLKLLELYPHEDKFVYLDPDIQVFSNLSELNTLLDSKDIVLTPHLSEPESEMSAILDNEICALKHGVFNLGFLAIRRSAQAHQFVSWWASRLLDFCYDDIPGGLFTDQRWIDLAPCFFDVYVLRHPGYNLAPWNLSKRKVAQENGHLLVNGEPLRFFHFSGFDSGANELMVSKYCPDFKDPVYKLRSEYILLQEEAGQSEIGLTKWSYSCYSNGIPISNKHRQYYRFTPGIQYRFPDPFDASDSKSFYDHVTNLSSQSFAPSEKAHGVIRQLWTYTREDYGKGGITLVATKVFKKIARGLRN